MRNASAPHPIARHYRLCGLVCASAFELPGAHPVDEADVRADVRIRRCDALPEMLANASARGPNWAMEGDTILLSIPGVGRCRIVGGRDIAVSLAPGVGDSEVAAFLEGSVFTLVLHQRHQLTLRAGAISVAGRAMLFCGPPGAGKSSLAAALGDRGYPFLADDLCRLDFSVSGAPAIAAERRTLRLWEDAIEALGQCDRRGAALRPDIPKFHVAPCVGADAFRFPIAAVYMLRVDRLMLASSIAPLAVGEAAMQLRRHAHAAHLATQGGASDWLFEEAVRLQRSVPLFGLSWPCRFGAMPGMIAGLEAHWRVLGLIETAA